MPSRTRFMYFLCAYVMLTLPAAAGELVLGGEGYAFTFRDTTYSTLLTFDPNGERPTFAAPPALDLAGLGWRARAELVFHGGEERAGIVVQRVRDSARDTLGSRFGNFPLEQREDSEAALTTLDARYERRVVSNERFELRLAGGYRYARAKEERAFAATCPVCRGLLDARFAQVTATGELTGHGMRAGLVSEVRLFGPLRLESEAGLALLAATQRTRGGFAGTTVLDSRDRRRSLATWDVSARLRAQWKSVSLTAGYRFERWSNMPGVVLADSDVGFDGATFGLSWRLGL